MAGNLTAMIAAAFSGGAAPPVTSDPYYEYTTLLLPGNGTNGAQNNTFLDGSTNNFTITRNGNTTQGTFSPFSQTGWGNYFDGSGDYLETPDSAALHLGTGDFTVEFWLYSQAASTQAALYFQNSSNYELGIQISAGNNIVAASYTSGGSANFTITSSSTIATNTWYHFALVRLGTGSNNVVMYINGVSVGTATYTGTMTNGTAGGYRIGRIYTTGTAYFNGYLADLRVVKGTAVYTSAFTPPTAPLTAISGTSLLTCQSNRFIDNSTNNFTITVNGNTSVVAFSPFNPSASWSAATYGGSGYFDGSGDYLSAASNAAFNLGTVFSVETFFYTTSTAKQVFFQLSGYVFYVESNKLTIWAPGSIGGTGTDVPINSWAHIVFTRDSSNQARAFVNGVLAWSASMTAASSQTIAYIGAENGSTNLVNGYMSNIRFVKGDIPTAYQTTSNTAGTTIFTPPTAPLTAITNTSLLLNFTNAGIYDATSKNDLETVGNAQISTTQSKWGGSSMYFDGTGDYLTSNPATTDMYAFGSGDFTIEFWLRLNTVSGTQVCYDQRPTSGGVYPTFFMSGSTLTYFVNGVSRITTTLSSGIWYHIALSRSGTSTKLFVDGTQAGSTYTDSNVYLNTALRPVLGADATNFTSNWLNGYLQDVRVTKGYARYTANFTAPTAAFPTL